MLDIIIPVYNARKTIEQTLSSILYQNTSYQYKVTLVDDSSSEGYEDILNFYSKLMDINYIKMDKNSGPAVARQTGIDRTNNPYILFIDADDVLSSPDSIQVLMNEILSGDYDVAVSDFLEELRSSFDEKKGDKVWLHGKVYKREFLLRNKIKFPKTRRNEDSGFNTLVFMHDLKVNFVNFRTYIWRNNKESLTRKNNNEFTYKNMDTFPVNMLWAIKESHKRKLDGKKIGEACYLTLLGTYFMYIRYKDEHNCDKVFKPLKDVLKFYDMYQLDREDEIDLQLAYNCESAVGNNYLNIMNSDLTFASFIRKIRGDEND